MKKVKRYLDKFWFLLWKDDSLKGWIFSILFLFIFIKLIFFPGLSLITGTSLPLAIVESCSMYHEGNLFSNYDNWWDRHLPKYDQFDISKNKFSEFTFKRGFNKGDILFIIGAKPEKLELGDIIIFQANQRNPVIHRIVSITQTDSGRTFSTMGDNNNGQLITEKEIKENQIIGKAVFNIAPYIGWGKLLFFEPGRNPSERGFCDEN